MHQKKRGKRSHKHTLKYAIKVLLVAFAVVSFWRGVWGVMDELLFPGNYFLSSIISIVIGVVILYFTKHLWDELM